MMTCKTDLWAFIFKHANSWDLFQASHMHTRTHPKHTFELLGLLGYLPNVLLHLTLNFHFQNAFIQHLQMYLHFPIQLLRWKKAFLERDLQFLYLFLINYILSPKYWFMKPYFLIFSWEKSLFPRLDSKQSRAFNCKTLWNTGKLGEEENHMPTERNNSVLQNHWN